MSVQIINVSGQHAHILYVSRLGNYNKSAEVKHKEKHQHTSSVFKLNSRMYFYIYVTALHSI